MKIDFSTDSADDDDDDGDDDDDDDDGTFFLNFSSGYCSIQTTSRKE